LDSNRFHPLKTKNLTDSLFCTIRSIRTKALVETGIEHAECLPTDEIVPSPMNMIPHIEGGWLKSRVREGGRMNLTRAAFSPNCR
jgi:hypothetical protein